MRGRGGGWVVAQFALMAAIAGAWLVPPHWSGAGDRPLDVLGTVLAVAGAALVFWAYQSLGPAMTPFPAPRQGGELAAGGSYRLARHPMYGGGLLLFAGISLVMSVPALVLTAALAVLWWRKSIAEERYLGATYDGYAAYRSRTRARFLPYLV